MSSNTDFYTAELNNLRGGIIATPIKDQEGFFGLRILKNGKFYHLWILCDDEGNGPGSFWIEEF